MKKRKKIVCFIFILCLTGIIFPGIIFTKADAIVLNLNWNVSIPSGYTVIYQKETEVSFSGDGARYHIFQYKGSVKIKNIQEWQDELEENEEKKIESLLKEFKVKKKYWPDFHASVCYSLRQEDGSELYMLFDCVKNCIYVLEYFM